MAEHSEQAKLGEEREALRSALRFPAPESSLGHPREHTKPGQIAHPVPADAASAALQDIAQSLAALTARVDRLSAKLDLLLTMLPETTRR